MPVQLVQLDHKVLQVQLVRKVQLVQQVHEEMMVLQDCQAQWV
jgi:hypothetical protein